MHPERGGVSVSEYVSKPSLADLNTIKNNPIAMRGKKGGEAGGGGIGIHGEQKKSHSQIIKSSTRENVHVFLSYHSAVPRDIGIS